MTIKNATEQRLLLKSLANTPAAHSRFSYSDIGEIAPKHFLHIRITNSAYQEVIKGDFLLDGKCGELKTWQVKGDRLTIQASAILSDPQVTITIDTCK